MTALGVQLGVYSVSTCWRSELDLDTPSRYLAPAGESEIVSDLWRDLVSYSVK